MSERLQAQLWSLCNVLRDEGVTYQQYALELGQLLVLRVAHEDVWQRVLGAPTEHGRLAAPLVGPTRCSPQTLTELMRGIQALDVGALRAQDLGALYESLLSRNAAERRSGAGQYFTPRALVESIVAVCAPQPGESIQDPAAGTGGFLIAAHESLGGARAGCAGSSSWPRPTASAN